MSVREKTKLNEHLSTCLEHYQLFKTPSFIFRSYGVSYIVFKILVKNEALPLLKNKRMFQMCGSRWSVLCRPVNWSCAEKIVQSKPAQEGLYRPGSSVSPSPPPGSFIPNSMVHKLNISTILHTTWRVLTHSGKWAETPFQIHNRKRERSIIVLRKNETEFSI